MRLFLDAHVSARRIATALREHGHGVRSADEERQLDGWEDERLLELATAERRVMVTFNVKDFARLATEWAAAGTSHAGILLIVGVDHAEFGLTLRMIEAALAARPTQDAWTGYAAWGPARSTHEVVRHWRTRREQPSSCLSIGAMFAA